jgi:hypothetical protein
VVGTGWCLGLKLDRRKLRQGVGQPRYGADARGFAEKVEDVETIGGVELVDVGNIN